MAKDRCKLIIESGPVPIILADQQTKAEPKMFETRLNRYTNIVLAVRPNYQRNRLVENQKE